MEKLKNNLAELVKVKTFVTIAVLIVFVALAIRGDIKPDQVMTVTTTVIAFYFGTQHEKTVVLPEDEEQRFEVSGAEIENTFDGTPVSGFGG